MIKPVRKHIPFFVFTIALIAIVFQFLYNFMRGQDNDYIAQFLVNFPLALLVVSADAFIIQAIYKKFSYKYNTYLRIILDLIVTSAFAGMINFGVNSLFHLYQSSTALEEDLIGSAIMSVLANCMIVLIIEVLFYNQKQLEAEKRAIAAEKGKLQYMYDSLRSQVNPHFLFNSLNTLSSLIYENQDKANMFTKKLSGLYRYALSLNEREYVTLCEELSFLESYLYLMHIRYDTALIIKLEKAVNHNEDKLFPMSIQLLVENAVKHNIVSKVQPLTIIVRIDEDGVTVSNNLQLKGTDTKSGLGLINLQEQYALHSKKIEIIKTDDTFSVRIPFL